MPEKLDEIFDVQVTFKTVIKGSDRHVHATAVAELNDFESTRLEAEYYGRYHDSEPVELYLPPIRELLIVTLEKKAAALAEDNDEEQASDPVDQAAAVEVEGRDADITEAEAKRRKAVAEAKIAELELAATNGIEAIRERSRLKNERNIAVRVLRSLANFSCPNEPEAENEDFLFARNRGWLPSRPNVIDPFFGGLK